MSRDKVIVTAYYDEESCPSCPICLDAGDEPLQILGCNHMIHVSCARGLRSPTCPVCREKLNGLPGHVSKKIQQNMKRAKIESIEEERRNIIEMIEQEQMEEHAMSTIDMLGDLLIRGSIFIFQTR